jgi:hypothetical protein
MSSGSENWRRCSRAMSLPTLSDGHCNVGCLLVPQTDEVSSSPSSRHAVTSPSISAGPKVRTEPDVPLDHRRITVSPVGLQCEPYLESAKRPTVLSESAHLEVEADRYAALQRVAHRRGLQCRPELGDLLGARPALRLEMDRI